MDKWKQLVRVLEAERLRQVKAWWRELGEAEKRGDLPAGRRIRNMLRSLGHRGGRRETP